jgi:hypothetical protein
MCELASQLWARSEDILAPAKECRCGFVSNVATLVAAHMEKPCAS